MYFEDLFMSDESGNKESPLDDEELRWFRKFMDIWDNKSESSRALQQEVYAIFKSLPKSGSSGFSTLED